MDRVKESIFAMIQNKIEDSTVLDLFAGSGNLGLEALSEGAKKAYLVDKNELAIQTMRKNINLDFKKALERFTKEKKSFDLIFIDPPYQTDFIEESIKRIEENGLLNDKGIIICESDKLEKIKYKNQFYYVKEKKYGDKYVVLLQKI